MTGSFLGNESESKKMKRDIGIYLKHLRKVRELQISHDENLDEVNLKSMSPETSAEREKFIDGGHISFSDLSANTLMQVHMEAILDKRQNPITYSNLPNLLNQETWRPQDAMLILAGLDPYAAVIDWSYENVMGAVVHDPVIRHANWFTSTDDLYTHPTELDFKYSSQELKRSMLEVRNPALAQTEVARLVAQIDERIDLAAKYSEDEISNFKVNMLGLRAEMVSILKARWDSGDHDANLRRSPAFFVQWAESRGFEIEWAQWARDAGYLDTEAPYTAPPFFDADAEDYPKLLHIAVRAWDHARKGSNGTAKQRITSFLEDRYPELSVAEKDAIAVIGNWQKRGGRPRIGG